MKGIDISNWQHGINLANIDVDFCIFKATEGIGYIDPCFHDFIRMSSIKGIPFGFYHFARENEPETEANEFYNAVRPYIGAGIPVLDYETENYDNAHWCERFIEEFYRLSGVWCMIYISASRCSQYNGSWIPKNCGLWLAGYPYPATDWNWDDIPYDCSPWDFVAIWQFTSSLELEGYAGSLDGDIAYMDADAWQKYANAHEQTSPSHHDMSLDELVRETLNGAYGNGNERKRLLGDDYQRVQNRINELYSIADEVINGNWGNGWNRQNALNGAGYPYDIVQSIVNDILG